MKKNIRTVKSILLRIVVFSAVFTSILLSQENYYFHPEMEWRTIETAHFFVHFHQGAERTATTVAKIAEDIYGPVTSLYQHEPNQKVSFIIKNYDDYSNGAAYFFDNRIEIWAPSLDFIFRGAHNWLRNVITHEFTHIVQIQTSMKFGRRFPALYLQWLNYEEERRQDVLYGYPNTVVTYPVSGFIVPSWFAEGVAQYNRPELSYDKWDSHRDMILRSYVLDSCMLSWSEMSVFGKTSLGNESSYNAGFALTKYISETYGQDAIPSIAKNISRLNNVTIDQAIERTLGISGEQLYQNWKDTITARYLRTTAAIRSHVVTGDDCMPDGNGGVVAGPGFANLYASFSPDGKQVAYTSNGEGDYLGSSSLVIGTFPSLPEKQPEDAVDVAPGVRTFPSWSPDGNRLYYTKHSHENPNGSQFSDIYVYDRTEKEETRITFGRRATGACLSPDGRTIAFTYEHDGTVNIGTVDTLGNHFRSLTSFRNGEQSYDPRWSPDGRTVIFGYSIADGRDIATVPADSGAVQLLIPGPADDRDAVYAPDGKSIVFASDRTGIFNLYRYTVATGVTEQITNVLGGAFMPTIHPDGRIAYSLYTSKGYKYKLLTAPVSRDFAAASYAYTRPTAKTDIDTTVKRNQFDFAALRSYHDLDLAIAPSRPYTNVFTSLSIIPFLRLDNYNTKSSGLDFLKPGFYFLSSDVLDKVTMFGGGAMNHVWERDLFLTFEYRGRILGLHQLGLHPVVSLELYNVTRKRLGERITIVEQFEETSADVTYTLTEADLYFKQHVFGPFDALTLGLSLSQYSSALSSFLVQGSGLLVPASSETYFSGTNLSLQYQFSGILPSRTREINPVGRSFAFRYDNEDARFVAEDSTGQSQFEATDTGIKLKLVPFTIRRLETRYTEHLQLPYWKHTLSFTLRGGTIFGPRVPDFFDFYAGGLIGMKGYPFYSISGNEIATLNVAYRFPIWENIDLRFLQISFDRLYGEFHADFGNAWNGLPDIKDFKRDAGFELRVDAFSWYAFPTRIFFNGTYGLDAFTYDRRNVKAEYGKEWRFYFGILFGFDFSNDLKRMMRGIDGL